MSLSTFSSKRQGIQAKIEWTSQVLADLFTIVLLQV